MNSPLAVMHSAGNRLHPVSDSRSLGLRVLDGGETVSFPPRPAMSVVGQLAICRSTVNRWRRRDRSNSRRSLGLAQTTAVDPLATIVSLNGNDGPCPHMRPSACTIVASASGRALPIAIPPAKFTLDHW